jgi:hypothetical protein
VEGLINIKQNRTWISSPFSVSNLSHIYGLFIQCSPTPPTKKKRKKKEDAALGILNEWP